MVMGYPGHLWSHGYDYESRQDQLRGLMMGAANWRELAAGLKVRYLFWGEKESAPDGEDAYPNSAQPWKEQCKEIASGEWGAIYDLQQPLRRSIDSTGIAAHTPSPPP